MGLALDKRRFKGKKAERLGKMNLEMDGRWHTEGSHPGTPEFLRKSRQGHLLGTKGQSLGRARGLEQLLREVWAEEPA